MRYICYLLEAFNAFLKTLEEPPKHVIFIMPLQRNQKSSQQYYLDVKPMTLKELVVRIAKHLETI